jgi:hypothetical protein
MRGNNKKSRPQAPAFFCGRNITFSLHPRVPAQARRLLPARLWRLPVRVQVPVQAPAWRQVRAPVREQGRAQVFRRMR